jgi:hypothetical protein
MFDPASMGIGSVSVATSNNGGLPPEHFARRVVDRLIYVGDHAPDPIKAQARAYRERMFVVVLDGIKAAIASDRVYRKD